MSFIGTQQKCKACKKTVYPVELLSADGIPYHKSCFKCSHCKGTLKLGNYSSMEGVVYCRPHFEQLFKESGNFNKNFQSPAKSAEKLTPELVKSLFRLTMNEFIIESDIVTISEPQSSLTAADLPVEQFRRSRLNQIHSNIPNLDSNNTILHSYRILHLHYNIRRFISPPSTFTPSDGPSSPFKLAYQGPPPEYKPRSQLPLQMTLDPHSNLHQDPPPTVQHLEQNSN
ncbi:hypothetical protein V6N11_045533 [Hibiscus sabdariffa]|uniref:LIM zinc-binding domain-containing protein n=1 Tax=Hibiscus sabdariffa TaxID=183260 RepID=A0ABR2Q1U4_9ROSI